MWRRLFAYVRNMYKIINTRTSVYAKENFNAIQAFFITAFIIFIVSYMMFHYMTPNLGFSAVFHNEPSKPFITNMTANLGVLFLFSGIFTRMIANIFYPKEK